MKSIESIRTLISENYLDEAIAALEEVIKAEPENDEAFYLMGNVYRKSGNWKQAAFYYLSASEINPDSPGGEAYRMMLKVRDFINPDYNP